MRYVLIICIICLFFNIVLAKERYMRIEVQQLHNEIDSIYRIINNNNPKVLVNWETPYVDCNIGEK